MGLVETEAIVLRAYNLAEADKIVVCLTRSAGVVRAVARGARRLKSRFGAGLEPFTLLSFSYYEREGRELVSLRQAEILRSYFKLAREADAVAALAYMSELVMEFAPPHEPNEKLFRMVSACAEAIARAPGEIEPVVRYFEVWMLKLAGFLPDLRACADCGTRLSAEPAVYLGAECKLRCPACGNGAGTQLSKEAYARLRATQRLPPAEFARTAPAAAGPPVDELGDAIQRLIQRALEREPRTQITPGRSSTAPATPERAGKHFHN